MNVAELWEAFSDKNTMLHPDLETRFKLKGIKLKMTREVKIWRKDANKKEKK